MQLGTYHHEKPVILAPMAGVSDAPFRDICLRSGADLAVHEMVSANADLRDSSKSKQRLKASTDESFKWVQIVGTEPDVIAAGAQYNVEQGADAIDINMGCPAKKVCKKAAGSALLADPGLVKAILEQTVKTVETPVTVKIRTGTDPDNRNALQIAEIAESVGVQCITIHGRTRADRFKGEAEYDTISEVKRAVSIPVIANGDISCPQKAARVLEQTNADGLMVGRAAYGNPWIFSEVKAYLNGVKYTPEHTDIMVKNVLEHIASIHAHYGDYHGVRIARKHIGWYLEQFQLAELRKPLLKIESADEQLQKLTNLLSDFALPEAS